MSTFEKAMCQSPPWRWFTRRIVLPWALQGIRPDGEVLEIGGGSGAMASELLAAHRGLRMTVTDFDDDMLARARPRLERFGDRVVVRQADATALPFDDESFDAVVSFIMLHHVGHWEAALAE